MQLSLLLFLWHMPDDATEGVAEHSFLCCNHQSTRSPSYSLYVQLIWYPMYPSEGMKTRISPVQSIEPHRILAPTQDSNHAGTSGSTVQSINNCSTAAHKIMSYDVIQCTIWYLATSCFLLSDPTTGFRQNSTEQILPGVCTDPFYLGAILSIVTVYVSHSP